MRKIRRIIIHCAATPNGKHFTVEDIDRWHKERGWSGIGYHWVVYVDGSIHAGRPEDVQGAHAAGYNSTSIGVCLIGTDEFSAEQWASLKSLVSELKTRYPQAQIIGHGELPDIHKLCPGFSALAWAAENFA